MADYKFDKPWAADSQNVKTFTAEEWGTGIPFKSLAESKVVNGIMQEVTSRFLELEAVEDRQYRYQYVVDDDVSWNNFLIDNIGGAKTVLIRGGDYTNENGFDFSSRELYIVKIENPSVVFLRNAKFGKNVTKIQGGSIQSFVNSENAFFENCVFFTSDIILINSHIDNCNVITNTLSGGITQNSKIDIKTSIENARIIDSRITKTSSSLNITNSILIRCTIPPNTKLTNCTLIDCDYTVDTYTANLVTGTTFRNCNVTIDVTNRDTNANDYINADYYNCTITINANNVTKAITGNAYDCRFISDINSSFVYNLIIYGNSTTVLDATWNSVQVENQVKKFAKCKRMLVDNPFFVALSQGNYYYYTDNLGEIYPGFANKLESTNVIINSDIGAFDSVYFFSIFSGTQIQAGDVVNVNGGSVAKFVVTCAAPTVFLGSQPFFSARF